MRANNSYYYRTEPAQLIAEFIARYGGCFTVGDSYTNKGERVLRIRIINQFVDYESARPITIEDVKDGCMEERIRNAILYVTKKIENKKNT